MLKKIIKADNPNTFHHVDAHTLRLWNVPPIAVDKDFATKINNLPLQDEESLLPIDKLSRIFSGIADEALHVVVRAPVGGFE
jgi:hypothetical protein